MKFLEYVPGNSLLHRLNPSVKLFSALVFAVACFCTDNLPFLVAMLAIGMVLSVSCKLFKQTLGLMKAVLIFSAILATIQLLTVSQGAQLAALPWGYIGTESVRAAFTTILRLEACSIPLFLVFYVTKISDLTNSAVKNLHVPYKYAFTFGSTVHFIPVFMNDMKGIMEAQTARGIEFDRGGIANRIALMAPLCVPLLVGSVRKTNSAAIAAEVRGFNLRTRGCGYKEYPIDARDGVAMALSAALLVTSVCTAVLL